MYKIEAMIMALKWGSSSVTAVKWGSNTVAAIYWENVKVWPDDFKSLFTIGYVGYKKYSDNSNKYVYGEFKQAASFSPHNCSASNYKIQAGGYDWPNYDGTSGGVAALRTSSTVSLTGKTSCIIKAICSGTNNTTSGTVTLYAGTDSNPGWINGNTNTYREFPTNYSQLGSVVSGRWSSQVSETMAFNFSGKSGNFYLFLKINDGSSSFGYSKSCTITSVAIN